MQFIFPMKLFAKHGWKMPTLNTVFVLWPLRITCGTPIFFRWQSRSLNEMQLSLRRKRCFQGYVVQPDRDNADGSCSIERRNIQRERP